MSSRFFAGDTSDESESDSGDEVAVSSAPSKAISSKYVDSDDDDDMSTRRVVKSAKDKFVEKVDKSTTVIKTFMKNKDWSQIQTEFDSLQKNIGKAFDDGEPSLSYINLLIQLDDLIKAPVESDSTPKKKSKSKSSAMNNKAMNAMKQKLKKTYKVFEERIKYVRENPEKEEDEEESDSDDEVMEEQAAPSSGSKYLDDDDSGGDDSGGDDSDDDDDDDDDSGEEYAGDGEESRVSRWMKKAGDEKVEKKKRERKVREVGKKAKDAEVDDGEKAESKVSGSAIPDKLTSEGVAKILLEFSENRGKKQTDLGKEIPRLEEISLSDVALGGQKVTAMLYLLSALFEKNTAADKVLPRPIWQKVVNQLSELLNFLTDNEQIVLVASESDFPEDEELRTNFVVGDVAVYAERLDEELLKAWQSLPPLSSEYTERVEEDEPLFVKVAMQLKQYYHARGRNSTAASIASRVVEHLCVSDAPESVNFVSEYSRYVYQHGDSRASTRSLLCHAFNTALIGDYHNARSILSMSHLSESIGIADISTQVLYNRAVVQVGFAAFRAHALNDAHQCLSEVASGGRAKELLAQGMFKMPDRTPEQEKAEKKRQYPPHLHLSLETIDVIHLTCALILDVPILAAASVDGVIGKKLASRTLRKYLDGIDRPGPAENPRETVVLAARKILAGDWRPAKDMVLELQAWRSLVQSDDEYSKMISTLTLDIQLTALQAFVLSNFLCYDSLSIDKLSVRFDLPNSRIHASLSKLLFKGELSASWHQPSSTLLFANNRASRPNVAPPLHSLCVALTEKMSFSLSDSAITGVVRRTGGGGGGGGRFGGDRSRGDKGGYRNV